jgi:subtilisin family serine protease
MNTSRQPSPFNTRNDATVVFAPGEQLSLPLGNGGELGEFSGTSFATPFAAGIAALALSLKRSQEPVQKSKVFISRKDIILLLRDSNHLGLNCDLHTYVMEPTCTETRYVNKENQNTPINVSLVVLLLLCIFFFSSSLYATLKV